MCPISAEFNICRHLWRERELVSGLHTLVGRSFASLPQTSGTWGWRKGGARKCRKQKGKIKLWERADDYAHGNDMKKLKRPEPRCVCGWCDTVQQTRLCVLRSRGCLWKWSFVFASCTATQSWMLSLASASCSSPSNHVQSTIMNFPPLVPTLILLSRYQFIITFPCSHLVHTLTPRKHVIWGVVFTPTVGYSRPPSTVNDPSVIK